MTTIPPAQRQDTTIEPGDWCVYKLKRQDVVYEVVGVEGVVAKLNAFHPASGKRFNCTCSLHGLWVIRKRDGTRHSLPKYDD